VFTVDELATIPLFSALTQKELEYLAGAVEDIHLIAGEYVAHEGEGRFLAIVVEGKTELTKLVNGVEQVIGVRLPGGLGGEIPMTLGTPLPTSMRKMRSDFRRCLVNYKTEPLPYAAAGPAQSSSAGLAQHRPDGRRTAGLDDAELLEPMGGVEPLVAGVACFEVRGQAVAVAALSSVPEQCRAEPTALLGRIDADQWEVPMAFGGMEVVHLAQDAEDLFLVGLGYGLDRDGGHRFVVRPDVGWQPQGDASAVADRVGCTSCERVPRECPDKRGPVREVATCIRQEPPGDRIAAEGDGEGGDRPVFV
jgi:hypothetical protein